MKPIESTGKEFKQFLNDLNQQFAQVEIIASDGYTDLMVNSKPLAIEELSSIAIDTKVTVSGYIMLAPCKSSRVLQNVFKQWRQGRLTTTASYLIVSVDYSAKDVPPFVVRAQSSMDALNIFLKTVHAKHKLFRRFVLDTTANFRFVDRFIQESDLDEDLDDTDTTTFTDAVFDGVKRFFSTAPLLGDRYAQYLQTGNQSLVTNDVFEFIAQFMTEEEHGYAAIKIDSLKTL